MSASRSQTRGARGWRALASALVVALASAGCPPTSPTERVGPERTAESGSPAESASGSERVVVLSVGGEEITRRELEERLEEMPEFVRARYRSASGLESGGREEGNPQMQAYLGALAQFEVMADVAERRELGDAPGVLASMEEALERRMLRRELRSRLTMEEISDRDVERHYDEHLDRYRKTERREALVIVTESEDRMRRLYEKLREASDDSNERIEKFRRLAVSASVDANSSKRGGSLGWVRPPEHEEEHPRIADAIFDLDERGELSGVFRVEDQWYVATWLRRKPQQRRPLESVAGEIRNRLYERRRERLREKLLREWRSELEIEVSDRLRERLEPPDAPRRTRAEQIPLRTREVGASSNAEATTEHDSTKDGSTNDGAPQ